MTELIASMTKLDAVNHSKVSGDTIDNQTLNGRLDINLTYCENLWSSSSLFLM